MLHLPGETMMKRHLKNGECACCLCGWVMLLRELRFGAYWELTCTRAMGRGTPGMLSLVPLGGLRVVTTADRQEIKEGGKNTSGGAKESSPLPSPAFIVTGRGCLALSATPYLTLWSQKVRGRQVSETPFCARGG